MIFLFLSWELVPNDDEDDEDDEDEEESSVCNLISGLLQDFGNSRALIQYKDVVLPV